MKTKLSWFDRIMTAVTFAEANEPDKAVEFLNGAGCLSEDKGQYGECDIALSNQMHGVEAKF